MPPFRVRAGEKVEPSAEQVLGTLQEDEVGLIYHDKNVDLREFQSGSKRNPVTLYGQGFADSLANTLIDAPATISLLVGKSHDQPTYGPMNLSAEQVKEIESGAIVRLFDLIPIGKLPPRELSEEMKTPNIIQEKSIETRVGEKMRNVGIALRTWADLQQEQIAPEGFGEQVVFGLGSGSASLLTMAAAAMGGAAVGSRFGPAGTVIGGLAAAGASSFFTEKAMLAKQLIDAGYGPAYADRFSTYYATPVAALDVASFGYMSVMFRPVATQVVKTTVGRMLVKKAFQTAGTKIGQVALQTAEGFASEGITEGVQQRIQTEFEIGLKLRDRNFQQDFTDDVVSFVVGGMLGGTAGAASQIRFRRDAITRLAKVHDLPRSVVAIAYDRSVLELHNQGYDMIIEKADISSQLSTIDKTFAKIDGKRIQIEGEPVIEPLNAQAFAVTADLMDAEGIIVDAKTKELQTTIKDLSSERLKLNRQFIEQRAVKGEESVVQLKTKIDDINARLTTAQEQYQAALAGNPKLQALEQKLADARAEFMSKDPTERATYEQDLEDYMSSEPGGGNLYSVILSEGGIAPYKKGHLKEEYREGVPLRIRNKGGLPLDEMADVLKERYPQLGITDEASLLEVLDREKMRRQNQSVAPESASTEELQKLQDKITTLETRIQGIQSPEETLKLAEQKVEKIQGMLLTSFEQLLEQEVIQDAIRRNPEATFIEEMGRAPTDKAELIAWRAEKEAMVKEEKSVLQRQANFLTNQILAAEQQAEAFKQGTSRVTGKISLNASQVRNLAVKELRNVLTAYKAGVKVTEQSMKGIQKAFLSILSGIKMSNKAKTLLLRKVLTVRNASQFNAKIGLIVDGINTILRTESVRQLQDLGKKILEKMQPGKQNVSPQAQLFAEHLMRVFRGTVPLNHNIQSSDPIELARAVVEEAVYTLKNAGDDANAANRAFTTVYEYYKDGLQRYADVKAQKEAEFADLRTKAKASIEAVGGTVVDDLKEAVDPIRQAAKRSGFNLRNFATPFLRSVLSILDLFDSKAGAKTLEGPLVKAFDPTRSFEVLMIHNRWARENIDGKGVGIYGPDFSEKWKSHIGEDFLDIPFVQKNGETRIINMPRAGAMSLYLMTKMPSIREDLVGMGIPEEWLADFEQGNNVEFTTEDYQWMNNVREVLDSYAAKIAPLYERLTGKPFRAVDNYFMVFRYMHEVNDEKGFTQSTSIIDSILGGKFEQLDPADSPHFKQRTGSEAFPKAMDIYESISRYAMDMNHFLAYAEYVQKMQKVFQDPSVMNAMTVNSFKGFQAVINEHIESLVKPVATTDSKAMRTMFGLLSNYARNQIAAPKNFVRQLAGLVAILQYRDINVGDLVQAAADLPRAAKSGELKNLLDISYMGERFAGTFEFAVQYAQDLARAEYFSSLRDTGPLGAARRFLVSKKMNDLITGSARYGDRWASIIGGWAVYQKTLKKTNNVDVALSAAKSAIESTQQSMDPSRLPVIFQRQDFQHRLLTIFQRTPAIYFDQYIRAWENVRSGQITKSEFARIMMTYHFWIPVFETFVTSGKWPWETKDETALSMTLGPFSALLLFASGIRAIASAAYEGWTHNEADLPAYLKDPSDSSLLDSVIRDGYKLVREVVQMAQRPDWEQMWDVTKAAAQVADVGKAPLGFTASAIEGLYEIFTEGLDLNEAKKIYGLPESRTKEK